MRMTVTIDPDVERRLREAMKVKKLSFQAAWNEAVRQGLDLLLTKPAARRFRTGAENMGTYPQLNYDNIGELLDLADKGASHGPR
jgi:hypothetical protein